MAASKTVAEAPAYEYLTADERRRMIENQLLMLERELFTLIELADPTSQESQADRIAYLQSELARLQALHAAIPVAPAP